MSKTTNVKSRQITYIIDASVVRMWNVVSVAVLVVFIIGLFLYLYGFHLSGGPPDSGQVVYVFDRDLGRFIKFAGSILAIFVTVGIFLWGFDVKKAAAEVKDARNEARQLLEEVRQAQQQSATLLEDARALLGKTQLEVVELADKVRADAGDVAKIRSQYVEAVAADTRALSVPEVARLYDFPVELDGTGQTIAVIGLTGGFSKRDLEDYSSSLGLPELRVREVSVDGAKNSPGSDAAPMVALNIEVLGAIAPAADIEVYFAPDTSRGFIDALTQATHAKSRPSVILCTWGGPESSWAPNERNAMNKILQAAAASGITVVMATGDRVGAQEPDDEPYFPSTSPWVLAVGGTQITVNNGQIVSEAVWNDGERGVTIGGISKFFTLPQWQREVGVPERPGGRKRRGVPDVAAHASTEFGYTVILNQEKIALGGTTASASLWAGLIALINQGLGRPVGFINPLLYQKIGPEGVLRDITMGDNKVRGVEGDTRRGPVGSLHWMG